MPVTWPGPLRLIAAVHAELGQLTEARRYLLESIERRDGHHLQGNDWYVWGRIAEEYDLREIAVQAYRKVEPPTHLMKISLHPLAQRRLGKLQQTRGGASKRKTQK